MEIERILANLPSSPGVYIMRDLGGNVIYVGKAINLKNRVRSYFQQSRNHSAKVVRLVQHIADIDYIVTGSELEALVLECNLIKEHRPHYNVRMRDDKTYPFIRVTTGEPYPRMFLTRKVVRDGSRYFGPYTDVPAARETLRLLKSLFPLRQCSRQIQPGDEARRPCLNFHIKRCLGPCSGAVNREDYAEIVNGVIMFLEGKQTHLIRSLKRRMEAAAANLDFEQAAALRDQLRAVERVVEQQRVVSDSAQDRDVMAIARDRWGACIRLMVVRDGKLVGAEHFMLGGAEESDNSEALSAFVKEFYSNGAPVPKEVLLPDAIEDSEVVESWLSGIRGNSVKLLVPQRGERRKLMDLAAENAREYLDRARAIEQRELRARLEALSELGQVLGLSRPIVRMECYDISNMQGTDAVGSMVVFEDGKPATSQYRRFRIKSVEGPNDVAMMKEMLSRRFARASDDDSKFARIPDLVVIDGGRGQLRYAKQAMEDRGYGHVPIAALAERQEEIYLPDRAVPLVLPGDSPALLMLEHIRDEAHRFAVSYHRSVRGKKGIRSELEAVPGIGKKRLAALMKTFGSLDALISADVSEIAASPTMNSRVAEAVWSYLHPIEENREASEVDGDDGDID